MLQLKITTPRSGILKRRWLLKMLLTLIAAVSENNVIGNRGTIPWHIPEDLQRFRDLTSGHPVIQGRKTYESIVKKLGHPLPGRKNIVLSKNLASREGILVARTVEEALRFAVAERKDAYAIGGEEVYRTFLPLADRMELTRVHKRVEGDSFFPEIDFNSWEKINEVKRRSYSFLKYEKK